MGGRVSKDRRSTASTRESKDSESKDDSSDSDDSEDDEDKVIHVHALTPQGENAKLTLHPVAYLGKGAFGSVRKMKLENEYTGETGYCAVKNPIGPERLNSMEKSILLVLSHQNICNLLYYYTDKMDRAHLIMEYVEGGDLFQYMKTNYVKHVGLGLYFELFSFQMWRAMAYCHANSVIHRDIKPENMLVNPDLGIAKLTDFGCSLLMKEEDLEKDMIFYIGTLIFRAPEMILGANQYSAKCDVWSGAILMSEMALGQPIFFHGAGAKAHMRKIMDHLGFPSDDDFSDMKVSPIEQPSKLDSKSITKRLKKLHPPEPTDKEELEHLLELTLVFSPLKRPTAWEVMAHPFYGWLRETDMKLPNGNPFPRLFNFSEFEIQSMPEEVREVFKV